MGSDGDADDLGLVMDREIHLTLNCTPCVLLLLGHLEYSDGVAIGYGSNKRPV